MSEHEDIAKKIQQELTDSEAQGRNIRPVEEVDVAVELKCADALQEFFRTNARLSQVPLAVKFKIVHNSFTLHCPYEIQFTVTLANGKYRIKGDPIIQNKIKSPDSSVIGGKVEKLEHGKYSIKYTPTREGKHEFLVVVKNNGSPDCEAVCYAFSHF